MALDIYAPCPCGSGKKIKFCCSHDIISDLDKIARLLEGEQRVAALDQINRVITAKGKRAALLCLKASVQISTNELAQAQTTVDDFLEIAPTNPAALAQASILSILQGNSTGAIDCAQRAMTSAVETLPPELYQAFDLLARHFVSTGNIMAARAHLGLVIGMSEENREEPAQTYVRLNTSSQVPMLLKQDFILSEAPEGVAWEEEFDAALDLADRQAWQAACEKLVALAGRVPPHSAILKNIAILRSWLGDTPVATAAWHAYAEFEDVQLQDAVEAEALAQLLDPESYSQKIDQLRVVYTVTNTDQLMEKLLSDKRLTRMPVDPSELVQEGEPPPKAVFWLLNRAEPTSHENLTRADVPKVLGEVAVYGKQTDREARLEFIVSRTAELESSTQLLFEVAGDALNHDGKEEVVDQLSAISEAITWRWKFPEQTPDDVRMKLIAEQRRETLFDVWPTLPLSVLDGKSAVEAAPDEAYRIRVLAAILLLELSGQQNRWTIDFNELRTKLGLPTRDGVELDGKEIARFSILRISLLSPEKLSDEELARAMNRAAMHGDNVASGKMARELINRPSFQGKQALLFAYEILSGTATTTDESIAILRQGREAAESQKMSPASLLIHELQFHLVRGDIQEASELIQLIQRRHIRENGIAQRLMQLLVRFGILNPDGTPRHYGPPPPAMAAAAAPAAGGLWTPDGESAAPAAAAEPKSKLWLPGMD